MRVLTLLLVAAVIIIGLTFSLLNARPVDINYYFGHEMIPLSLLMASSLAVGSLLGIFASVGLTLRTRRENRSLRRKVNLVEKEVANLRALPLQDEH